MSKSGLPIDATTVRVECVEGVVNKMYKTGESFRLEKNGNPKALIEEVLSQDYGIFCVGLYCGLDATLRNKINDKKVYTSTSLFTEDDRKAVARYLLQYVNTYRAGVYYFEASRGVVETLNDFVFGREIESRYAKVLEFRRYFINQERQKFHGC